MKKLLTIILVLALMVSLFAGCQSGGSITPDTLEVQLIPSRDASVLDAQRKPLQDLLEAELDMPVNVTIATDYNALIEGMASEQIHVGLLATTAYVLAADEGAAEAILKSLRYDVDDMGVKQKDQPLVAGYKAQLVVHKDSGITDVKGLAGKKIAISSFTSTSGFVWPANLLADNGIDPESGVEWINAGGHDNAILAVYNGEADAAFTFKDARTLFEDEDNYADIQATVKFIVDTTIIPNDTISVIPNLTKKMKDAVKEAFLAIAASDNGLEIIRAIYSHEGYAEAKDSDYDEVRTYLERKNSWGDFE